MLATLRSQDFQSLIHHLCKLTVAENHVVEIELMNIVEKPNAAIPSEDANARIPFSLLFKTSLEQAFVTDYCHFHHPDLGVLENLAINRILPVNPWEQAAWYQIVFN
ncbi:hypothetical protein DOJK_01950 [Patescibacteria group bacterium]|nr:hypothetical protein DOJK_01950 [Patescibacteria group bacterium]